MNRPTKTVRGKIQHKIADDEILDILKRRNKGETLKQIAEDLGTSPMAVHRAIKRNI